jgi:hypothetical protein
MKTKPTLFICTKQMIQGCTLLLLLLSTQLQAQDDDLGLRASWMKGSWGALWLPENCQNGNVEGVTIDDFITQIEDLRTIDYIQVGLTGTYTSSPVHTAPNDILESLWEGDVDSDGDPTNLIVPRSTAEDPFLSWLTAIKAAGLKTEVYVNTCNLLQWIDVDVNSALPDIPTRWKEYCDNNATVQTFINSESYHTDGVNDDRRPYMFCYAEFILKEYAIRYGDLIDAWCFDAASANIVGAGDTAGTGLLDDERIYEAFADAAHAGNPDAAICFNNGVGVDGAPLVTPTLFEDYSFGHPFGGAGNMVSGTLYDRNYAICEYMSSTAGLPFASDDRSWNDNVVGHFFPKQSTTSWNSGATGCLTDDEFVEWNATGLIDGGAITWGTPLVIVNLNNKSPNLTLQTYALTQLSLTDDYLKVNQSPGAPNWARQNTVLPTAIIGKSFSHTLTSGTDFWDPEGDTITKLYALSTDGVPSWLSITETSTGVWTLSGTPTDTEAKDYTFRLRIKDASGGTNRWVTLSVEDNTQDVEIKATANTNYGVGTKATMTSDTQTAPDGLATYKISIQATPTSGTAIISGTSGGTSTENSWGIGDGTDSTNDDLFNGSSSEWVKYITNIQVVDFESNGSTYTSSDITTSFKSITIVNAQSTNDFVSFKTGSTTNAYGKLASSSETTDLETVLGVSDISSFSIGAGDTSTTNKWSVEGINVNVTFNELSSSADKIASTTTVDTNEDLILYPNPVINTIELNMTVKYAEIFDLSGKLIKVYTDEATLLDASSIASGTYVLRAVSKEGKVFTEKFIK